MQNYLIIFGISFLTGFGSGWTVNTWKLSNQLNKQKIEASNLLIKEQNKVIELQNKYNKINKELELKNEKAQNEIKKQRTINNNLVKQLGGLRDPGRRESCTNPTVENNTTTTNNTSKQTCDSRLSEEASQFLLELAEQADTVANYATVCFEYIQKINKE